MRGTKLGKWVAVAAVVWGLWGAAERDAEAQPALDAAVILGVDGDLSAVGRLLAGGIWQLGRFAPEAHVGFDGFLPIDSNAGITARSISLINLGARVALLGDNFTGPFVSGGGGFGLFTGKPHERQVDDPEVCAAARPPTDNCAYNIDKSINARLGFGWGFEASKKTTVAPPDRPPLLDVQPQRLRGPAQRRPGAQHGRPPAGDLGGADRPRVHALARQVAAAAATFCTSLGRPLHYDARHAEGHFDSRARGARRLR